MPTLEYDLNDLIERALAAAARGDLGEALSLFNRAASFFPRSEQAWFGRILLTGRLHHPVDVGMAVKHAIDALPGRGIVALLIPICDGDAPWGLPLSRLAEQALLCRLDEYVPFVLDLGLALSWSDPAESGKLWLLKAEDDLRQRRFQEAIGALQQADALGAASPACRYLHALEYERLGEPDLALAAYREAMSHETLRPVAMVGAARLSGKQGQTMVALELCREAIRLKYETFEVWRMYTKIALLLGLNGEVQLGLSMMCEHSDDRIGFGGFQRDDPFFAGFSSTEARSLEHVTFLKKLPRLLEQQGLLLQARIRVRDWAFSLPQACERWPLGALASGSLTAAIVDRERRAFVSCHVPAGQQVDPGVLGFDALHGWCYLLDRGLVSQVTFAANASFAPRVHSSIEGLSAELGGADRLRAITLDGRG